MGESAEVILDEAAVSGKRKRVQDLVYKVFDALDPTGANTKKYKAFFGALSDAQFERWIRAFLKDENENFFLEVLPYENEPKLPDIKRALGVLGVPLEEYVYYRHDGNKDKPLRTAHKAPVGYLNLKRLQQVLTKKNAYSIDIDVRNAKTNQATGDNKVARITDAENYSLNIWKAEKALEEFLGPRADNNAKKTQMYKDIASQGYVQLSHLKGEPEDSQTINTVDVYLLGAGIKSDLVTPGLVLTRTMKGKQQRERTSAKYQK